jgi:hypothetical protein
MEDQYQKKLLHHIPDPHEPLNNEYVPLKIWTHLPAPVYDRYNYQIPLDDAIETELSLRDPGISRRTEEILINELIENAISILASEEEEMENSAAELLTIEIEEIFIDDLIGDISLFTVLLLDEEEGEIENRAELVVVELELERELRLEEELYNMLEEAISELMLERSGTSTSPGALRNTVSDARGPSNEDHSNNTEESVSTPEKLRKIVNEAKSLDDQNTRIPSNESGTTEVLFFSPGSLDSDDITIASAFILGEQGSNI